MLEISVTRNTQPRNPLAAGLANSSLDRHSKQGVVNQCQLNIRGFPNINHIYKVNMTMNITTNRHNHHHHHDLKTHLQQPCCCILHSHHHLFIISHISFTNPANFGIFSRIPTSNVHKPPTNKKMIKLPKAEKKTDPKPWVFRDAEILDHGDGISLLSPASKTPSLGALKGHGRGSRCWPTGNTHGLC